MKVLLFIASQGWGGAEKVFVDLANHLSRQCELHVILLKGTCFVDRFDKRVRVTTTPTSGSRRNPFLLRSLYRTIREIRPDVVHTHAAKATEMFYFLNKLLNIPHVATKHNARKGRIFNKIRWVTTVSEQAGKTIHNHGRVEVIYNGIIPREIAPQEKIPPFSIIAVGRLDRFKAFDILIREAGKLPFDFVLHIVGEGEERGNLERVIREQHLEENIFLLGHREEIPELLARSHLLVISSRTEGFSLVAVEGLYYADILISTRVGIAEEILPAEFLISDFNIAEKIEEIHDNYEDFRNRFEEVKKRHRPLFLLPDIAGKYLDFYEEITAMTSRR